MSVPVFLWGLLAKRHRESGCCPQPTTSAVAPSRGNLDTVPSAAPMSTLPQSSWPWPGGGEQWVFGLFRRLGEFVLMLAHTGTLSRLPTQCHWPSRWGLVPLSRHCVVWGAHYQSGKCQPERPRGSGAHCCSNQRGVEPKRNISQSSLSSSLFPDGGFVF